MIRAFAIRTASALGDRFVESCVLVSAPVVGIMSNCVGASELCAPGCTLMGPVDVGLLFGIMDNACVPGLFDARKNARPRPSPGSTGWSRKRARPVPIVVIQVPQYNPK
jgi:hypothetical protein